MIELVDVRWLVEVNRAGSLGRAASRLHVTPSGLSHWLAGLEERVEARLFERRPAGLDPTPVGAELLRNGEAVLSAMRELEEDVLRLQRATS